jgi:UDP-N-acetylmuramyl pentapeptide phosphotransferase/UDP-N-acetylglucosamine-1-phosphate transferase
MSLDNLFDRALHLLTFFDFLIVGFGVSFFIASLIFWTTAKTSFGIDYADGIQKFHVQRTSRLGGIAIGLGLIVGVLASGNTLGVSLAVCAAPVFAGGLIEDLTNKVGPNLRLLLAFASASLGFLWLGVGVNHVGVWPIDQLLALPAAAFVITLLVVAGFTNGINIIDGFHGLASGISIIMLASFFALAWTSDDTLLIQLCGLSIASIAAFLLWNWPQGKIFLGDSGAYLLGFWVVEVGLLLILRNPEISPITPVVIGVFPLIETIFSMYRRKFLRMHPMNHPDALHLHTLVYRRLVLNPKIHQSPRDVNSANARVAWYFWFPASLFSVLALAFRTNTPVLLILVIAYLGSYLWLYRRLVKLRAPIWMKVRSLSGQETSDRSSTIGKPT